MENPAGDINWSFRTFLRVKPPVHAHSPGDPVSDPVSDPVGEGVDGSAQLNYEVSAAEDEEGCAVWRIELEVPLSAEPGLIHNNTTGFVPFCFNNVFGPTADQADVFNSVRDMIVDAFRGINCTVLAYGQTGTGKTFSISGGDSYALRGLIPRGIKLVFDEAKARGFLVQSPSESNTEHFHSCLLFVSFTEIYGDSIYDLLDPEKRHRPLDEWPRAQVLETEDGLVIRGINVFQVQTAEDALNLFFMGNTNRLTSSTVMNKASSRSHAVFTLIVETHNVEEDSHVTRCGKINFVDLAGSERIYKETNSKEIIKEGKSINLSLHYLEQVIISLRAAHNNHVGIHSQIGTSHVVHIPYRNCILTSILRDSLGGNCRSCFLFTISMDLKQFEETVSTCRFAQRVGEVKVRIRVNQEIDVKDQLRHVNKYVAQLEEKIFVVEAQRDRLQIELDKCSAHCSMAEEKNRIDRKLTVAETKTNKALVLSILSGNSTFFGNSPAQAAKTTAVDGSGSTSNHEEILHSSPSFENIRHDGFPVSPSLSGHIIDWGTQDKAVLVDLCSELAKALVMVNTEKKNAIVLQSQTSSSAAAFVAQRFAGKARRQSFNKSQSRSTSNMSVSPPGPNVAICNSAGSTSFGASHSAPNINGISDNHSTPTPGYSPPQNYAQIDISPHQNGDIQRSLDNANLDGEFVANHDAASPGSEFRDRGVSDASAISGAIFSLPAELSNTVVEQATDETEDAMRRNDVFIDMLVFGDQFLKHGRIGVCGRGLRHISVSTDLKFLCRSHINNLKSMKMIPLADINRVEVGHGYPKLKNRENCLLTIIGKDLTMDLECFCFESFQENKVFAENWAMGLTYCIARAKGQIRGDSPVEGV